MANLVHVNMPVLITEIAKNYNSVIDCINRNCTEDEDGDAELSLNHYDLVVLEKRFATLQNSLAVVMSLCDPNTGKMYFEIDKMPLLKQIENV